jgi:hypothetical protein
MKYTKTEIAESKAYLQKMIKPGDTIYTKMDHVSRSGMYRVISLYIIKNNELINISYYASKLLEGYDNKHEGCKASGCGMDMGFHLVYNLGSRLFGFGPECAKLNYMTYRNGEKSPEVDGGYLLKQRWF